MKMKRAVRLYELNQKLRERAFLEVEGQLYKYNTIFLNYYVYEVVFEGSKMTIVLTERESRINVSLRYEFESDVKTLCELIRNGKDFEEVYIRRYHEITYYELLGYYMDNVKTRIDNAIDYRRNREEEQKKIEIDVQEYQARKKITTTKSKPKLENNFFKDDLKYCIKYIRMVKSCNECSKKDTEYCRLLKDYETEIKKYWSKLKNA